MVYIGIYHITGGIRMQRKAKLFINGRSQAVRLPKEFRFEGDEVSIRKVGKSVIIEPVEKTEWPKEFWKMYTPDKSFKTPEPLRKKDFSLDD